MKRVVSSVLGALLLAVGVEAATAPDAAELTKLLNDFLAGASRNDAAVHDRFWAEDLIYTGSVGRRVSKADILSDVRSATAPKPGSPTTTYTAEEIRIQQYGDTAVVAFRFVGTTEKDGKTAVAKYLNSGTFLKRNGKWQVVNWQATRLPRPAEEARKDALDVQQSLHQALLAADVKALESMMDESFVWTHRTGEQVTRQQLLEQLGSGRLKYAKLETNDVTVAVYGDTAVVRGASPLQRSAFVGSDGAGDPAPVIAYFTLTLVDDGAGWRAVAMHTSRIK